MAEELADQMVEFANLRGLTFEDLEQYFDNSSSQGGSQGSAASAL
jgi:hypothetical protein